MADISQEGVWPSSEWTLYSRYRLWQHSLPVWCRSQTVTNEMTRGKDQAANW